jgi:hypothetical protein
LAAQKENYILTGNQPHWAATKLSLMDQEKLVTENTYANEFAGERNSKLGILLGMTDIEDPWRQQRGKSSQHLGTRVVQTLLI